MALEGAIKSAKPKCFCRSKCKAGSHQQLTRTLFEIMSAQKNLTYARRQNRFTPPIELNPPRTVVSNDGGAKIRPGQLCLCRGATLDRVVDDNVDGFEREIGLVEVRHD